MTDVDQASTRKDTRKVHICTRISEPRGLEDKRGRLRTVEIIAAVYYLVCAYVA